MPFYILVAKEKTSRCTPGRNIFKLCFLVCYRHSIDSTKHNCYSIQKIRTDLSLSSFSHLEAAGKRKLHVVNCC